MEIKRLRDEVAQAVDDFISKRTRPSDPPIQAPDHRTAELTVVEVFKGNSAELPKHVLDSTSSCGVIRGIGRYLLVAIKESEGELAGQFVTGYCWHTALINNENEAELRSLVRSALSQENTPAIKRQTKTLDAWLRSESGILLWPCGSQEPIRPLPFDFGGWQSYRALRKFRDQIGQNLEAKAGHWVPVPPLYVRGSFELVEIGPTPLVPKPARFWAFSDSPPVVVEGEAGCPEPAEWKGAH